MPDDTMFAPLTAPEVATGSNAGATMPKPVLSPIIPVPADALPCGWRHPKYGKPVEMSPYRDRAGGLVGYAARVEYVTEDGQKQKDVYPLTFNRVDNGEGYYFAWRAHAVPAPRPLYRSPELVTAPASPVVVTEGEKKAELVPGLFPGYLGTTSMGGAKAARLSNWTPLAGRNVTIWPDHDETGQRYAAEVAALATAAGAASVAIVEVPADWPEKWDLADPIPDGSDQGVLAALLASARPWTPPARVARGSARIASGDWRCFNSYRMTEQGLFWVDPDDEKPDLFLASAFKVLAQTRDSRGSDWGLLLRWPDPDGRMHEWAMPREVLGGRGDELWRNLLRDGLTIASSTASRNKLADYLGWVQVEARARSVTRIGWHASASGQVFVLPDATFGEAAGERVLWQTEARNETFFNVSGSLEDWREEVARRCIGNSRLVMAASTSFAPPLLDLANEESGGIHFIGKSRTGKTVALRVAGSVWGGGGINGFIRSWRATSNGLEGIAEVHSDALLCLDEMGQVDAREAGETAYMLANGAGKGRAGRDGSARRSAQWRLLFLSSGELSLADKMAEAGKRVRAGQEVRLVDVPADAGAGMGIFENLHGAPSPGEFAEILRVAVAGCYGTPIRSYLDALTEGLAADRAGLRRLLETTRQEFMSRHLPTGASPQVRSVCGRFALIGAAGSLATAFGVTGWPDDEADRAAGVCFQAWLRKRGTVGDQEIESGIRQVIRFLEEHGSARFEPAWEESGEPHPGVVTTVTAGSNARLPENPYMNQYGSHSNRGNRGNDGYAAGSNGIEPAASIDLNQENRSTASPFVMRTINRAGFRRQTAEGLWQYMALPEAWKTEITKGFDPHGLARAMVDRGLIIPDPTRKTPARQVSVKGHGKPRLYVFKAGILGDAMIVSGDGEQS